MNRNRIWIELDRPLSDVHGEELARKASLMVNRMGVPWPNPIFWSEHSKMFCFVTDEAGSFEEAGDNGHWYNLDWLAKEEPRPSLTKLAPIEGTATVTVLMHEDDSTLLLAALTAMEEGDDLEMPTLAHPFSVTVA